MTRIGFVGLGNMGGPMARNLVAAGHEVRVFDLVAAAMEGVGGAAPQASAAACVDGVDVFISMLPAGRHVESLYLGDDGIVAQADASTLLIDCSTIDPDTARRVAQAAADRGIAMLDAPVSGGTAGAEAGTLTFMVGGDTAAVERARPVLDVMAKNVFHAGGAGAGQTAKICNNMLLAVHMAGTAEALALGVNNGLDPAVLSEIMKQSSGGNWSLNVYNPFPGVMDGVPASRGYQGGFLVDLMTKDLGLAMASAEASGSAVPLGSLARNLFRLHGQVNDAGRLDFSSIQRFYKPDLD
ncbi:MAG: 3-hydroxyisobutyrate dehydrogenase [Gammaproteobacteria bacterium]|nr:3-hydroxyisobutyrate dehydrogenase [Gammaproteobacteria bacterium]